MATEPVDATQDIDVQEIQESEELDAELDEVDAAAEGTLSKGQEIAQKIAQQLPFLQKFIKEKKEPKATAKMSNDDEDEEGGEEVSQKSKGMVFVEKNLPFLASFLAKLDKSKSPTSSGEEYDDDEDEEEAPKRRLTVIHVIIIIGVAYVAYDELMAPKEPEVSEVKTPPAATTTTQPEIPATDAPEGEETADETPETEIPVAETPATETPTADPPKADSVADQENGDDEFIMPDQDLGATGQTGDSEKATDELDELFAEENIVAQDPASGSEVAETEVPQETEPAESPANMPVDSQDPVVAQPSEKADIDETEETDELQLDNSLIDQVLETEGGEEITEAILKQLEKGAKERRNKAVAGQAVQPTDPPAYLSLGRGLVYNCLGRHWACVDSRAFQQCGENYAWNLKQSLEIECYPNEVYESDLDCASMQQYKIDMAAPTDFCGNN